MREIKFRLYFREGKKLTYSTHTFEVTDKRLHIMLARFDENTIVGFVQYTGLKDKNGKEIYEGDILEFADKWEWYKTSYGIKMRFAEPERRVELQKQYDAEPMERRVIEIPGDYDWLLSHEIQSWWHVIGNIFENPKLMATSPNHNLDDK